jgi:hypothetical protein
VETSSDNKAANNFKFSFILEALGQFPDYFSYVMGIIMVEWQVFGMLEDKLLIAKRKNNLNQDDKSLLVDYYLLIEFLCKLGILSRDLDRCFTISETTKQKDKKSRLGICAPEFYEYNSGVLSLCEYGFVWRNNALSYMAVLNTRYPPDPGLILVPPIKGPQIESDREIAELQKQLSRMSESNIDWERINRILPFEKGRVEIDFGELFTFLEEVGLDSDDINLKLIETLNRLMEDLKRFDLITEDLERGFVVTSAGLVVNPTVFLNLLVFTKPSDLNRLKRYIAERDNTSISKIRVQRASEIYEVSDPFINKEAS